MAIWLTEDSQVIVQGITGSEGTKHTGGCSRPGTNVVGGVNARKAGTRLDVDGTPGVRHRRRGDGRDRRRRVGRLRAAGVRQGRRLEAIDAEIPLLVVITEGIPVQDTAYSSPTPRERGKTRIIGPNCPGSISPGESNAGIIPADITGRGPIGLVSQVGHADLPDDVRAARHRLLDRVGIGGDPVIGTTHIDCLAAFESDPDTDAIVMIGEIGGDAEERAADFIQANVTKPVVGYVAGFTAPEGKTMGHAGAIVSRFGTAAAKKEALEAAGVQVGKTPSETAKLAREILETL